MAEFRLTPAAKGSLVQIATYTEHRWGREQRYAYIKQLDDTFHLLADAPELGRQRPDIEAGLRSHPSGRHIIYYLPQGDFIVIVDILHHRMDPLRHLPAE